MKFRKTQLLTIAMIGIFLLSSNGNTVGPVSGQNIETNFELLLVTQAGSRTRESYAFFIKQAVAPLGIDVNIQAKPFGQFVGDLLHISLGQPYDLAIVSLVNGPFVPEIMERYHSEFTFGSLMYQLDNPDWQAHQLQDTGVNQTEVDLLLESIDFELDLIQRQKNIMEFTELFMTDLLYNLPLITLTGVSAGWLGYGDDNNAATSSTDVSGEEHENNDLWDLQEGTVRSRVYGATWNQDSTPDKRTDQADLLDDAYSFTVSPYETLQFSTVTPGSAGMFDPYQVFDTATGDQSDWIASSLMSFDFSAVVHPDIAYNFIVEDWDKFPNGTDRDEPIVNGKYTFFLNADGNDTGTVGDWVFPETTDYEGNVIPEEVVDANDFGFAIDMLKFADEVSMNINGFSSWRPVNGWEARTTVNPDDTLVVYFDRTTPNDDSQLSGLVPMPEHILNGTLNMPNGDTIQTFVDPVNPQQSLEWAHWASQDGISLPGPYELAFYNKGENFGFTARDDFPYPNEWDMEFMYDQHKAAFDSYYTANVDTTAIPAAANISHWAPHKFTSPPAADFWNGVHGGNSAQKFKPAHQGINLIVFKQVDDTNARRVLFEAGQLDFFGSAALGAETVNKDQNDPNLVVKQFIDIGGPQFMVFNLLNEHTQKRDVRFAIAHATDREEMLKINDGFGLVHQSPVWRAYELFIPPEFIGAGENGEDLAWYSDEWAIDYDYATARDLMRANGYSALDSPDPTDTVEEPPIDSVFETIDEFATIFDELGSNMFIGISAFAITSVVLLRRFRR